MTDYTLALFLHIVGAVGLFSAMSLEWSSIAQLRRAATAEQAGEWLTLLPWIRRTGAAALAALLLPALYMTVTAWGWAAWIVVSLGAMLLLALLGALNGLRLAAIERAMMGERSLASAALREHVQHPLLWTSLLTRIAIALGLVLIMVMKPALGGALLTIGIAVGLGLAASLPAWRRNRTWRENALP